MNLDVLKRSPAWQRIEDEETARVFEERKAIVAEFEATKARLRADRPAAEAEAAEAWLAATEARRHLKAAEAAANVAAHRVTSLGLQFDNAERRLRRELSKTTSPELAALRQLVHERLRDFSSNIALGARPDEARRVATQLVDGRKRLFEIRDEIEALMLNAVPPTELAELVDRLGKDLES